MQADILVHFFLISISPGPYNFAQVFSNVLLLSCLFLVVSAIIVMIYYYKPLLLHNKFRSIKLHLKSI